MSDEKITTLPTSKLTSMKGIQAELSEESRSALKVATSGAMSSLTESSSLLIEQMKKTVDPKVLIEAANALASTVQTQVNMVKVAKDVFKLL